MPFYYGSYDWGTIISTIANDLANTNDWEIYDNQVPNGVALRHVPSNRYLCIRKRVARIDTGYSYFGAGIQVSLSSNWDPVNHVPSGTIKSVFGSLYETWSGSGPQTQSNNYLTNYMGSDDQYPVWLWVDKRGFLITTTNPFPYDPATSNDATYGFFMDVEVIPLSAREYNDGLGDFFLSAVRNDLSNYKEYSNQGIDFVHRYARDLLVETTYRGFDLHEIGAIKSLSSGKVYFEFPYLFNDAENNRKTVSAQTKRFFIVANDRGLAPNDIINWIDPQAELTRQFVVAQAIATGTGANTTSLLVAIPYSNACTYD